MFPKFKRTEKIIYFDHAAATPLDREVKKALEPFLSDKFGNPSLLYSKGREAKEAVESSRAKIAELIGARPSGIIFTAGGSESVNLAIFGVMRACLPPACPVGRAGRESRGKLSHLITSAIEHHCVINSFKALEGEGHRTTFIDVDGEGFINLDKLKKSIRPETILISIMYANNEVGTIEPIAEIGKWLKAENEKRKAKNLPKILFHTDACQAAGFLDLNVNRLGVDLMSVNGSKIYGPKQSGFLYVRDGVKIKPLIYGGGQERNLRSGTENVPGIVGLAKALELAQKDRLLENKHLIELRDYFIKKILTNISQASLNGPAVSSKDEKRRLPNNINLTFQGVEGEALMLYLDSYGICIATGSACATEEGDPSHVLLALGKSKKEALSSIRITLGKQNTKQEVDWSVGIITAVVKELRKTAK